MKNGRGLREKVEHSKLFYAALVSAPNPVHAQLRGAEWPIAAGKSSTRMMQRPKFAAARSAKPVAPEKSSSRHARAFPQRASRSPSKKMQRRHIHVLSWRGATRAAAKEPRCAHFTSLVQIARLALSAKLLREQYIILAALSGTSVTSCVHPLCFIEPLPSCAAVTRRQLKPATTSAEPGDV